MRTIWSLLSIVLGILAALTAKALPTSNSLVITHATIIDVRNGQLRRDQTILTTGDRLTSMYELHSARSHGRVRSTSATGKSTLPVSCRISLRRAMQPACKHLAVIEQVLEPGAQQQMSPILVRLHQHGQEKIAALFCDLFGAQNL
jgi:hypothetical protein